MRISTHTPTIIGKLCARLIWKRATYITTIVVARLKIRNSETPRDH